VTLNCGSLIDAAASHALTLGYFERVNQHEPKVAPGKSLTAAVWVDRIRPARRESGLDTTSALVVLNVRLYTSMTREPQDAIDPEMTAAVDALMTAYTGDFTLGGLIRNIDIFGKQGVALEAQAGYLTQDSIVYRVITVAVPMVVNDAWSQAE
jgi:hypothetical protein